MTKWNAKLRLAKTAHKRDLIWPLFILMRRRGKCYFSGVCFNTCHTLFMVKVTEVANLFLEVCPAAKPAWETHLRDWEGEPPAHYIEISVFAHHLIDLYEQSRTESFSRVFELVERLIIEGDDDTQGVIIVGLLEGLQNIASWRTFGSSVFEPYLRPESLAAWRELENFWEGKESLADVIRAESEGE